MSLPVAVAELPIITADIARELAIAQRVCIRPVMRRVEDRQTGAEDHVAIPCGSTREAVCPPCAHKARVLRMQQCTEGWHRTDEPERPTTPCDAGSSADAELDDGRQVRSTRRRQ